MGTIYYGSGMSTRIEDRTLAHLKVAIVSKLRRNESFTLSWAHPDDHPEGRSTLWLHPAIPLRFVFDEPEAPQLNREWLEQLMRSANSTGGIQLVPEHLEPVSPPALPGLEQQRRPDLQRQPEPA
ncbi:hypothetical protein MUN74_10445 [Agromyces endophyticus]|uniref:DUF7882 family protein n=1 Tax=Agromyces sp. H17E-10 TaxID=2932244 RepID=UPI001FCFFC90|nr:hypothetical protein [Agromyces sp. H17E-10]UOQ87725.1 hypothetical protein MUN74_10445 [Agromyces sp. H17E-10]